MATGVALIGVGMVGRTYVDALAGTDLRLVGALGLRAGSGAAFLAEHGLKARAYGSVAEVAADPEVAFVILATPPNSRVEIVEALAAAGKPILMEKPVERSLDAAVRICEICEAAGVPLGIMLQHRARPSALALRERVTDLGALQSVEISVPWWREQGYYDEPGRGSYARDGGGVLISQAIHTLDLALQFTGPVREVVALTATTAAHRMEAEDFVASGLRFENGAVGSLFATTASYPGRGEEIILHYAEGSVRMPAGALRIDWRDGRSEEIGVAAASGAGADPMAFTSDWHRAVIEDFASVVARGGEPLASGRSALGVHAVIEALEEAGRTGARTSVASV